MVSERLYKVSSWSKFSFSPGCARTEDAAPYTAFDLENVPARDRSAQPAAIICDNCSGNMGLATRKTCLFEKAQQMKVLVW